MAHPHLVRCVAAGNDERVEVLDARRTRRDVGLHGRQPALALEFDTGRRTDERDCCAGLAQRFERPGQLAILETVLDEDRDALALQRRSHRRDCTPAAFAPMALPPPPRCECHNALMNRLGQERSPYLLQHAENPVDWFAWGD